MLLTIEQLADREGIRRVKRNQRDRLARDFLKEHPELKTDPSTKICDTIPEGTTENAIRSIARFYQRQKMARELLRSGEFNVG